MENQSNAETKLARPWVPVAGIVFAVAVIAGVGFMGGGAGAACVRDIEHPGPCEGGSWGGWGVISFASDGPSCTASFFEQRAYHGMRVIIHGSFKFGRGLGGCTGEPPANAAGVIASERVSCEIVETRVRAIGSAEDGACAAPAAGSIKNTARTEMTGAAAAAVAQLPGTYRDYLNAAVALQNSGTQ